MTVHYATANQTATSGSDYTARSGTLTIPAGLISVTQAISVKGDTTKEPAEVFKVTLTNATGGAKINRANGFGQILNDDPPKAGVRAGIGNSSVLEGNANRRSLRFTVSISKVSTQAVKVKYATPGRHRDAGPGLRDQDGHADHPRRQDLRARAHPHQG